MKRLVFLFTMIVLVICQPLTAQKKEKTCEDCQRQQIHQYGDSYCRDKCKLWEVDHDPWCAYVVELLEAHEQIKEGLVSPQEIGFDERDRQDVITARRFFRHLDYEARKRD